MIYYTIPLNSLRHLMELCILCGTTFVQEMYLNEKMKHFTSQIIHTTSRCKIQTDFVNKKMYNPMLVFKSIALIVYTTFFFYSGMTS